MSQDGAEVQDRLCPEGECTKTHIRYKYVKAHRNTQELNVADVIITIRLVYGVYYLETMCCNYSLGLSGRIGATARVTAEECRNRE